MKIAFVGRSDSNKLSEEEKRKWVESLNKNSEFYHIFIEYKKLIEDNIK